MAYLARGGSLDLTVPAGQSIALGSPGGGVSQIFYRTKQGNTPQRYYLQQTLVAGTVTLGPFAADQEIRLLAALDCELQHVEGVSPVLSGGGTSYPPFTLAMLVNVNAVGDGPVKTYPGGPSNFSMSGTFNDAIATLHYSINAGATWIPTDVSLSAPRGYGVQDGAIPANALVKMVVAFINSGTVPPSGLNATLGNAVP